MKVGAISMVFFLIIFSGVSHSKELNMTLNFTDETSLSGIGEFPDYGRVRILYENEWVIIPHDELKYIEIISFEKKWDGVERFGAYQSIPDYVASIETKAGVKATGKVQWISCYVEIKRTNKLTRQVEKTKYYITGHNGNCKYSTNNETKKIVSINFN